MSPIAQSPQTAPRSRVAAESETLFERLRRAPHAFDFFQAVRRLEAHFGRQGFPRIGFSKSRSGDPFHFGQRPFMEFAPRTIDSWNEEGLPECRFRRPAFLVYFYGLFGPNGVLPLHLTEYALERHRQGDYTFTNFANILHHRFLSFLYRAWASARITADLDQPERQRFSIYVGSFLGLGSVVAQGRDEDFDLRAQRDIASRAGQDDRTPAQPEPVTAAQLDPAIARLARDWPRLYFAGRLAAQTRNAEGLESVLQEYFGVPTEVHTFFGRWYDIPLQDRCQLGLSRSSGSLGQDAVVGAKVWDCQMSFRIRLGPMGQGDFAGLLPGSRGFERLSRWVFHYVGYELLWDVQLVLRKDEVPDMLLGRAGRLGWTTFVKGRPGPLNVDRGDCVLMPSYPAYDGHR